MAAKIQDGRRKMIKNCKILKKEEEVLVYI